jgi:hypothetical protein
MMNDELSESAAQIVRVHLMISDHLPFTI